MLTYAWAHSHTAALDGDLQRRQGPEVCKHVWRQWCDQVAKKIPAQPQVKVSLHVTSCIITHSNNLSVSVHDGIISYTILHWLKFIVFTYAWAHSHTAALDGDLQSRQGREVCKHAWRQWRDLVASKMPAQPHAKVRLTLSCTSWAILLIRIYKGKKTARITSFTQQ